MMWGWHDGYGGYGWFWGIGGLIVLGLVVFLVTWAATSWSINRHQRPGPPPAQPPAAPPAYLAPTPPRPEPIDILRERLARGEISVDEFETAKRALGYPPTPPTVPPPGPPTA